MRAWRAARRSIGHHGVALGYGSAVLGDHAGFPFVGGPWWAGFALAALGLLALCLRIVFPQDSRDKLAWWRDRRLARRCGEAVADAGADAHKQAPGRRSCRGPVEKVSSCARDRS